jgi:hypothetical protein
MAGGHRIPALYHPDGQDGIPRQDYFPAAIGGMRECQSVADS